MSNIDFVDFDKFLYTKVPTSDDFEYLFEYSTKKLNIKEPFKYQASFYKNNDFYHIFLKEYENSNLDFLYPKALIFENLINNKIIKEENFAILSFGEKNTFLCFFQNKKFTHLKQIIKFDLNTIKNSKNKEEIFYDILNQKGKMLEFLNHYKSEVLIIENDKYDFLSYIKDKFNCKNINSITNIKKLLNLCPKYLNKEANFIKEDKEKIPFFYKLIVIFFICFFINIVFLCANSYQEFKSIKENNQNINNEISKLNENEKKLKNTINELIKTNKEKNTILKESEKINKFLQDTNQTLNKSDIIIKLTNLLNKENLQIINLNIEKNYINIIFHKDINKSIFKNSNFKVLEQNKTQLKLKYENE